MVERYRPSVPLPASVPMRKKSLMGQNVAGKPTPIVTVVDDWPTSVQRRKEVQFLSTGCAVLDCTIGGGWPFGRVVNIVGDRSVGKTLLAEEAIAMFQIQYPRGRARYRESEAAFDPSYFESLGGDPDRVDFGPQGPDTQWDTVEDIIEDTRKMLDDLDVLVKVKVAELKKKRKKATTAELAKEVRAKLSPGLYIVDSLDGLSSRPELKRAQKPAEGGTYGLEKQKLLGEFFRTEIRRLKKYRICVIIISQVRERIGAMIKGEKYTRTGGKALDFYASIVVWLANLGKVYETIRGIKRPIAIRVKADCKKNKISMPFRQCEFEIRFGYGTDDEWASLDYLKSVNMLEPVLGLKDLPKNLTGIDKKELRLKTIEAWHEVEKRFIPEKGKYAA